MCYTFNPRMKFSNLTQRLRMALVEDGAFSDITTRQIPRLNQLVVTARIVARKRGVFCGGVVIRPIMSLFRSSFRIVSLKKEGSTVKPGDAAAVIRAKASVVLSAERLLLNFITHLSGVATITKQYVSAVKGTKAVILDTRKTTPLWRDLERHAVTCGGGENHRSSLSDAVLVKDNHMDLLGRLKVAPQTIYGLEALPGSRRKKTKFLAMEARDYREVWEGIKARAGIILLDNMSVEKVKGSIVFVKAARTALKAGTPLIEVSGGLTPAKARQMAKLGVDRISVGALTHSAPALDFAMEVH